MSPMSREDNEVVPVELLNDWSRQKYGRRLFAFEATFTWMRPQYSIDGSIGFRYTSQDSNEAYDEA